MAVIEAQSGYAVSGRTQAGVRFSVRKTHLVTDGHVNARALHVSPSQIVQYTQQCPRQWALDKIAGIKREGNKFSDRGVKVHQVLENWQRFATPPNRADSIGAIAYPALAVTPAPGTATSERCVNWEIGGIEIEFLKDLEEFTPWFVHIYDYKTTSNLTYAHTAQELLETDPQAITYAAHAFIEYNAPAVRESWLYLTANKPHRCLPVVVDPQRDDCLARFDLILAAGREMIAHRIAQTPPEKFPERTAHCPAHGGCPYKGTQHCHPDAVRSVLEQMQASIFSQIAAAGQPAPTTAPAAQPAAVAWPPPVAAAPAPATPLQATTQPPAWLAQQAASPAVAPAAFPVVAPAPVAPAPPMPASTAPPAWLTPAPVAQVVQQPAPEAPAKRTRRTRAEIQAESVAQAPKADVAQITHFEPAMQVAPAPEYAAGAPETPKGPFKAEIVADDTEAHFWDLLSALAMAPGYAASPAVDLADRAFAIVVAGQRALGGS